MQGEQLSSRSVNTCSGGGRRYFLDAGGWRGYTTAVDAEQRLPVSHLLQPRWRAIGLLGTDSWWRAETRIVPVSRLCYSLTGGTEWQNCTGSS